MIIRFFKKLKRSISWFIFMWNNYDWDYVYLYKIIYKKLTNMEKSIRNGNALTKQSKGRQIKICRWYLDKLINGSCDSLYNKFYKKFGDPKFNWKDDKNRKGYSTLLNINYDKCKSKKENKYASDVLLRIHKHEEYLYQKYKEKVFDIMNKYINYWWD